MIIQRFKLVVLMFLMTVFFAETDAFACIHIRNWERAREGLTQRQRALVLPIIAVSRMDDPDKGTWVISFYDESESHIWSLNKLRSDCDGVETKTRYLYTKSQVDKAIKKYNLRRVESW